MGKGLQNQLNAFKNGYPNIEFHENMASPTNRSVKDLKHDLDNLNKLEEDMRARLNMKAVEALPRTEDGVKTIRSRLECIEKFITYHKEILEVLDRQKMNLVHNAYNRVNTEFGFMMSTLLPESHAKLVPVNPRSLADGITIHVKLGGVWKESLTELSGGQRSLVALSLVLSLCMYNPSPFYVLDEIDSALDLNHTANIGYLIKSKFTNVQFICVSLKDGMFNNANVIFRTYFEQGTSCVKVSVKTSRIRKNDDDDGQGPSRKKQRH